MWNHNNCQVTRGSLYVLRLIHCNSHLTTQVSTYALQLTAHRSSPHDIMSASSSTNHPQPPPVPPDSPPSTSVRRHHTISSSSRAARNKAPISEESQEATWNQDDEVVTGDKWIGAGLVGSGLHRQASLPSRYNRGLLSICRSSF